MRFARGRARHTPGQMNKLEESYYFELQRRKEQREIDWFKFEHMKLKLADKTFYTPDFAVMKSDGELQMHEVKGFWEDHARVKIKVAAAMYPMRFIAIQKIKKEWVFEEIGNKERENENKNNKS